MPPYDQTQLARLSQQLSAVTANGGLAWCIFDNTALGSAHENAIDLHELLSNLG